MYLAQHQTDRQIAEALPVDTTERAVKERRKRLGIRREGSSGGRSKDVLYEEIRDELPQVWAATFRDKVLPLTGGVIRQGSAQRVAEHYGISQGLANKWLRRAGLLITRPNTRNQAERLSGLYFSGLTVEAIATQEGLSTSFVSRTLKAAGVKILFSQERRTAAENEAAKKAISLTKVGPEIYELFSSREKVLAYLGRTGLRSIKGIEVDLGVSHLYLARKIKELDLWDEMDHYASWGETEVRTFLKGLGIETVTTRSVISPHEIDMWSAEHRIGIEYNGNFYHSEASGKERLYHQKKALAAIREDVRLYHVFEYHWADPVKRKIIEGQIRHMFGRCARRVGARQCEAIELGPAEKNAFLEANHLQGSDHSTVKLGLRHEQELVAVMTFRRPHLSSQTTRRYQWELSRYATKIGAAVAGGASRLFTEFVRRHAPESVMSFSDLSRSAGEMYGSLGFAFSHVSAPNYVWARNNTSEVLTRYQTQVKDEISTMKGRGYYRIYDCGNKVWEWHAGLTPTC